MRVAVAVQLYISVTRLICLLVYNKPVSLIKCFLNLLSIERQTFDFTVFIHKACHGRAESHDDKAA